MSNRLTLDYGMRFVHQGAQYDKLGQASNFLPDSWSLGAGAGALHAPAALTASPCTGNNRVAVNPAHRIRSSARTAPSRSARSCPAPVTALNGLFLPGEGHPEGDLRRAGALALAPRFGAAYDLTGDQQLDRSAAASGCSSIARSRRRSRGGVNNPPTSATVTAQFSAAADRSAAAGLSIAGRAGPDGVQLRLEAAGVDAVERRHADRAAVGDDRRRLRTSASTGSTSCSR